MSEHTTDKQERLHTACDMIVDMLKKVSVDTGARVTRIDVRYHKVLDENGDERISEVKSIKMEVSL